MQGLALFAAGIHLFYPFYVLLLAVQYDLAPRETALWMVTGFFFGIFGIWPLVFYDFYLDVREDYCRIPLAIC